MIPRKILVFTNCRGYMAPEYLAHGQLTEKVDVYSYGVLLLEIITGRQNNRSKTTEYTDSLVTIVSSKHIYIHIYTNSMFLGLN